MRKFTLIGMFLMCFTASAFAQAPSKADIVAAKATYSGTLTNLTPEARKLSNGADWAVAVTVLGDGVVKIKWYSSEGTYNGAMGPSGGKVGAPLAMNAEGADKSQVRLMWTSPTTMQFDWWPNMAAKAGQTQHKPPHASGMLTSAVSVASSSSAQTTAARYEELVGNYAERTGGKVTIRKADDAKQEAGPLRFILLNGSTPGNWRIAVSAGVVGSEDSFEFMEGPFKGSRYLLLKNSNGKVNLHEEKGNKTIWMRQ